jgi:hypothetical protein
VARRCFCGRSKAFPLCDGSHVSEAWRCAPGDSARVAFVAGPHLENLALRLAHEHGGLVARDAPVHAELGVVLTDGSDLDRLAPRIARVESGRRVVVAFGAPTQAPLDPDGVTLFVDDDDPIEGARAVSSVVGALLRGEQPPEHASARSLAPAFLSHAVLDEAELLPAVGYLRRRAGADLFLCADGIAPGADWHRTIADELAAREVFVLVLSKSTRESTFCAYETGQAIALGKRVRVVSLEPVPPPFYVQHLMVVDVQRLLLQKPWLDRGEALVEALLRVLA